MRLKFLFRLPFCLVDITSPKPSPQSTMETESKTVCTSDKMQLSQNKKVHWALNLEEISYFTPHAESKNAQSLMKKLKIKARILKKNTLTFCDRELVHKLQERFARIVERFPGFNFDNEIHEIHAEDVDFNKYWDELFELYGPCKPAFEMEIDEKIFRLPESIQE